VIEKGKRLGLVIRGGTEYGLGIFISGVDPGSLSDLQGISVGDQILSVNGIDFLHITHEDAVHLLRNLNEIQFHLRQMNKVPQPKHLMTNPQQKNSQRNFLHFLVNPNEKNKLKNSLKEYLEEKLPIDQFVQNLFQILHQQNQQNRFRSFLSFYLVEMPINCRMN